MTDDVGQLGCQTEDMLLIHRVFRREFSLAPSMVRHVATGDTAQARRVATYLAEIVTALHHHHQNEDRLLWDTLAERTPACALHVDLMKQQHAAVAQLLEQVDGLAGAWLAHAADKDPGERLAALLDEISERLQEHLGQEEGDILPAAATSFTQAEWDRLREAGMAGIPRNRLLVQLGYILEDADPQERQQVLSEVPLLGRALYRAVGRRAYEREIRMLRPRA